MILLLDCLTTLNPNVFYSAFEILFRFDALHIIVAYASFLTVAIFSLGDEGGIDLEELDRRVRATISDAEIIIPNTYRPVYYYFVFAGLPFIILWEVCLSPTMRKVKPNTIYQDEYAYIESVYYAPHTIFCMYICTIITLLMYRYSEEDIIHWDPKQEWKHSYVHAIMHQTADWIILIVFILYPIYFFTYPFVEHTHTAYLFYFIIIFWAPFCSYHSYLPEEFEIVNADVQPGGEILDVPKMYRVRKSIWKKTQKYLKQPTMRIKKGYTFQEYADAITIEEDDYLPVYDGADLFTWPRYIILFIITVPIAFLMLYFV